MKLFVMMKLSFVLAVVFIASVAATPGVDVAVDSQPVLWKSSSVDAAGFDVRRELIAPGAGDYGCALKDEDECDEDDLCEFLSDSKVCVDYDLTCEDLSKAEYTSHFKSVCKELTYPNGDTMCKFNQKKKSCITLQNPEPTSCDQIGVKAKCNKASKTFDSMKTDCYWTGDECEDLPTTCDAIVGKADCNNAMREFPDTMTTDCYFNSVTEKCVDVPTTCAELPVEADCNKADKKFGIFDGCFFDVGAKEPSCVVLTECSQILSQKTCKAATNVQYPSLSVSKCMYQKKACIDAPESCEDINGKRACNKAELRFGLENCKFMKDGGEEEKTCVTVSCAAMGSKNKCRSAFEKYGLQCYFEAGECMELDPSTPAPDASTPAPTVDCSALTSKKRCSKVDGCKWDKDDQECSER